MILVHGFGVNDAKYRTSIYKTVNGKQETIWLCPFYSKWASMLKRCFCPKEHARYPTYIGSNVSDEWIYFSAFKEWMQSQPWVGNHLDKDLLFPGNKTYSAEKCVFVPANINTFVCDTGSARGNQPIGVYFEEKSGRYRARCCNPFIKKLECLGRYDNAQCAHEAWRARKHEHACRYADQQTDPRLAEALRKRYEKREPSQ